VRRLRNGDKTFFVGEFLGVLVRFARLFESVDRHLVGGQVVVLGVGSGSPLVRVGSDIVELGSLGVSRLWHRQWNLKT
jgi:hypothetical protein